MPLLRQAPRRALALAILVTASAAPAAGPLHDDPVPLAGVEDACRLIGDRLRSVEASDCVAAGLQVATIPSAQGQPLLWRDYPPAGRSAGEARRVLLVGGIHGDELTATSVVFDWMRRLEHDRFQGFHWRVVPCLNPDGLLARPATRVNANGVDLNRNFATPDWALRALPYWEKRTRRNPRNYPGPRPLSEPESRWLASQVEAFKPDAVVQVHAPYGLLDFDGPHEPPERIGFLHLSLLGAYPGSLGNFAGLSGGKAVLTLELPDAWTMPSSGQASRMWSDLLGWLDTSLAPARRKREEAAPPSTEPWLEAYAWLRGDAAR